MSEDDFNSDEGEGIKDLRKKYEADKKEMAELRKQVSEFQRSQRTNSVAEILKAKGIPISAAKLYNGEEATEDAVGKWLEDYADVFNVQASDAGDDENAKNAQRVNDASFGRSKGDVPSPGRVLGDPEEIQRLLDTQPYEELVKLGLMPNVPDGRKQPFRR